jgi:anti-sigma factor RsiW
MREMYAFSLTDCDGVRGLISADLDGELPEFERGRLSAHLRICPECSVWAGQIENATRRLREAPLEVPAARIALPQRGRRWAVAPAVAVSSAAALVASLVVAIGPRQASVDSHPALSIDSPAAQAACLEPESTRASEVLPCSLGYPSVVTVPARPAAHTPRPI